MRKMFIFISESESVVGHLNGNVQKVVLKARSELQIEIVLKAGDKDVYI